MLLSTKVSLIFPLLMFKGRILSIEEDKDRDLFFIDPFLIDPPKVSNPISRPSSKFEPSIEPTPKNRMTSKAYSRKKVAVPLLIQVQDFEPNFGN